MSWSSTRALFFVDGLGDRRLLKVEETSQLIDISVVINTRRSNNLTFVEELVVLIAIILLRVRVS